MSTKEITLTSHQVIQESENVTKSKASTVCFKFRMALSHQLKEC